MSRRRLYVFGAIIVIGVLVGIFCLPGSEDKAADRDNAPLDLKVARNDGDVITVRDTRGGLPDARIGNTASAQAQALVEKAKTVADLKTKGDLLAKAYAIDPKGKWGGEAAAELGDLWKAAGDMAQARQWYALAAAALIPPETRARISPELDAPRPLPVAAAQVKMVAYKVQPNDSLWKIARVYATSTGSIMRANNLKTDKLRVDMVLKIPKGPFDVVISKRGHTLQLLQDGAPVKTYEVGLGDTNNPTPTGSFVVQNKLVDPVWYSPEGRIAPGDPKNLLGSRWIGFDGKIGIHGTRKAEENTIGKDMSNGCVRMRDEDVKELYDYLADSKSKVTIAD